MTPEQRAEAQRLAHELDRAQSDAFDLSTQQGAALRAAAALLRALLDAPAQEPVAWRTVLHRQGTGAPYSAYIEANPLPSLYNWEPLYAAPVAQTTPQPEDLTSANIEWRSRQRYDSAARNTTQQEDAVLRGAARRSATVVAPGRLRDKP